MILQAELWAREGYLSTPDGNSIYFWGFAPNSVDGAQLPGPVLVAVEGEPARIVLHNELNAHISLFLPGQGAVTANGLAAGPEFDSQGNLSSFATSVPPGGSIAYEFTAGQPGTYLYQSGTDAFRQVLMGLYGGLVVRPSDYDPIANRTAYGAGTGTGFEREYLLITGEIDPDMNLAVMEGRPFALSEFHPRYWTLNGRCAPDTMFPNRIDYLPRQPYSSMIICEPGERVLMRYLGSGIASHPLHPHGNHTRVVGEDGGLLSGSENDSSYHRFTVLTGPGQSYDQIFSWEGLGYTPANPIPTLVPDRRNMGIGEPGWTMWSGSPYLGYQEEVPVGVTSFNQKGEYYFMLHAHDEYKITNWGEFPGGMMTMLGIYPSLPPEVGTLPPGS